jgi:hypothetical protein
MTKGFTPELPVNPPQKGEVYKHYKGDSYEVVGLAIHSNDDIWMVVYKPLYENADAELFTRPLQNWRNLIEWDGKEVERFSLM